jgi:hypothetical protein
MRKLTLPILFIRLNLRFNGIFEIWLIEKESIPLPRGRKGTYACVEHTCKVRLHSECLRRHPISECSASTSDRRHGRRPGSAPGPPAPVLRQLGPLLRRPAPESSEQLPSIAPWWPHPESRELGCATTWLAVCRRVALRSSIPVVVCRADG